MLLYPEFIPLLLQNLRNAQYLLLIRIITMLITIFYNWHYVLTQTASDSRSYIRIIWRHALILYIFCWIVW
jgi:hypothetical protein